MTRPNMSHEPLSAEERAFADRLVRLGADDGPAVALDTRILAAARATAHAGSGDSRRAARHQHSRQHWPFAFATAAILALALGLSWQSRPRLDPVQDPTQTDPPMRAVPAPSTRAESTVPNVGEPDAAVEQTVPVPAPESNQSSARAQIARNGRSQHADVAAGAADASAPAKSKSTAQDKMERSSTQIATDTWEQDPPTQQPATSAPVSNSDADEIVFDVSKPALHHSRTASTTTRQPTRNAVATVGDEREQIDRSRTGPDQNPCDPTRAEHMRDSEGYPEDEIDLRPPATADAPEVQRAWLQRIRELIANGETEAARTSLAEFKRRNARYALPEDLRDLAP